MCNENLAQKVSVTMKYCVYNTSLCSLLPMKGPLLQHTDQYHVLQAQIPNDPPLFFLRWSEATEAASTLSSCCEGSEMFWNSLQTLNPENSQSTCLIGLGMRLGSSSSQDIFTMYIKETKNVQGCVVFSHFAKIPALCTVVCYLITLSLPVMVLQLFHIFCIPTFYYLFLLYLESSWCFFLIQPLFALEMSSSYSSSSCDMYSFVHNFLLDIFSILYNNLSNCHLKIMPTISFFLVWKLSFE